MTLSGGSEHPRERGAGIFSAHMLWCRVTSSLVGKSYSAAGQAAATLHSMAVLQAYQAELLKELDEGEGISTGGCEGTATGDGLGATCHQAHRLSSRPFDGRDGDG